MERSDWLRITAAYFTAVNIGDVVVMVNERIKYVT